MDEAPVNTCIMVVLIRGTWSEDEGEKEKEGTSVPPRRYTSLRQREHFACYVIPGGIPFWSFVEVWCFVRCRLVLGEAEGPGR